MKTLKSILIIASLLIAGAVFNPNEINAQKKGYRFLENNKRGITKRPSWVKWSKLKTFKTRKCRKLGFEKGDDCFMFVVGATENEPYKLEDVERLAALQAAVRLAEVIMSEVDASVEVSTKIEDGKRQNIFNNTQKLATVAKFSGYNEVAKYWEIWKDKEADNKQFRVYALYTIEKEAVYEHIARVTEKLGIPEIKDDIMTRIESEPQADDMDNLDDIVFDE